MKCGFVFGDNSTVFLALPSFGSLLLNSVFHFAQIVDFSSEVIRSSDKNFCLTKISLIFFFPLNILGM